MGPGAWSWIVPDGLWEIAEPLIPPSRVRPQGGGTQDTPDETLFAAIIYVLVSGCAWRGLCRRASGYRSRPRIAGS
ncbi:transposase [Streptomyces sp. NPDC127036]|uniref:transposase n=1 Tax=Streptomyces sp. NPDC127036 TaxID=3347112 RepID=UPI003646B6DD